MTDLTLAARLQASVLHSQLLAGARQVGGIYHLDYQNALVSTDDRWKADAGGLPQHAFLLATVMPLDQASSPEDEEVLLLRVDGTCQLPRQTELVEVREFTMRQMLTDGDLTVDVLTQQEMQRSGLSCRILGTFYQSDLPGLAMLDFGADIDNIYAASRYRVYKPSPAALEIIASYPQSTEDELRSGVAAHVLQIGSVRYSSTRRRARDHGENQVPVRVRVADFIEMKTAVFGMTRMGKSNTMKTLAVATYRHSKRVGDPIGQLLFDPQGEYANVNAQDEDTALAQLGEDVRTYRFGANPDNPTDANTYPLQINFYDSRQIAAAQEIIASVLAGASGGQYIDNFAGAELGDPQAGPNGEVNWTRRNRNSRARLCFHALLGKAGFACQPDFQFRASMAKALAERFNNADAGAQVTIEARGWISVRGVEAVQVLVDWLLALKDADDADAVAWLKDPSTDAVIALYQPTGNRLGWRWMSQMRAFHSPRAREDYADRIHQGPGPGAAGHRRPLARDRTSSAAPLGEDHQPHLGPGYRTLH